MDTECLYPDFTLCKYERMEFVEELQCFATAHTHRIMYT